MSHFIKTSIAKAVTKVMPKLMWDQECYRMFEKAGFHVTANIYYQSIPDSRSLNDELWEKESSLVGLDLNVPRQLEFLNDVFPKFRGEYNFPKKATALPHEYYSGNDKFTSGDAEVLHSMIRHFKPKRIIEIGSGFTTYISARACLLNKEKDGVATELISIEPNPNETLKKGFPGLSELIAEPLEKVDLGLFESLEENDILFIDSTHVLKIGGDVQTEYLEIIPRLKKGVVVHSHDVFFPCEYPKEWVKENHWFWTEQYLLQAFLAYNSAFEVLWAGQYMNRKYPEELKVVFPDYTAGLLNGKIDRVPTGSLWIRRKTNQTNNS